MEFSDIVTLDQLKPGETGEIVFVREKKMLEKSGLPEGELERRLLEMGFIEGTLVTLLHEGPFGRDPLAVSIRTCVTVAIRRKEAQAIGVRKQ